MEEVEKIEIDVIQGLDKIFEMIKPKCIAEESGISYKTLKSKSSRTLNNGFIIDFSEEEKSKLNIALSKIGKRIQRLSVIYTAPRDPEVAKKKQSLQVLKEYFQLSFFFEKKFGKDTRWMSNRMKPYNSNTANYYFSEEEIFMINMAIKEASSFLLSVRLV